MSILDICDDSGNISPWASGRLLATMLYPGAEENGKREQIFEDMLIRGLDLVESDVAALPEPDVKEVDAIKLMAYRNLYRTGIGNRALLDEAGRSGAEGMLAGMLLRFRLRCSRHRSNPKDASINRAYFVVNGLYDRAKITGVEIKMGVAVSKLKKYWKRHSADCHLHAAALVYEMDGACDDWLRLENIPVFLAISEIFAAAAEGSSLDSWNSSVIWRPPPALQLPEVNLPAAMDALFPPLTDEEISVLKQYRVG